MNTVIDFVHSHGIDIVALLAALEGIFCAIVMRRSARLRARMRIAVAAAEDAARAAALAAPGGIDPEIVIQMLRSGRGTSLEAVYQIMEQQAQADEAERRAEATTKGPEPKATPTLPTGPRDGDDTPPSTSPPSSPDDVKSRLGRYG